MRSVKLSIKSPDNLIEVNGCIYSVTLQNYLNPVKRRV
nr:MAG TPA: hypothetical protein [Caudoviricetes sp.]